MRKHLATASASLAVTLTLFAVSIAALTPAARAQNDNPSRAIRYLQTQQRADGSLPAGFSTYDATEFYAISAAAAGYDPSTLSNGGSSVMQYLAANVPAETADAGNTGRLILAVVAAKQSPTSFGGTNLVTKLNSFYNSSTGAYAAGSASGDALAVMALAAAGQPVPAAAVAYIKNAQDSDGGWGYTDVKDDPSPFAGSDTNSTGYNLMALAAAGDHSRDASALAWLKTQFQNSVAPGSADGGFPYQAGGGSDPVSTSIVLQALIAAGGQGPNLYCTWSSRGVDPIRWLASHQDAATGGFAGYSGVDVGTTSQAAFGLLELPFGAFGTFGARQVPATEQASGLGGLRYLKTQQRADGSLPAGFSTYDATEFYAISAAAAGYDPSTLSNGGSSVMQYLAANVPAETGDAGNTGRLILAVVAAKQSPSSFGGTNLVTKLNSFYNSSTGAYAAGSASGDALAVMALAAAGQAVPAAAVAYIKNAQDSDGGWGYTDVKDDPSPFAGSDTNSTGYNLMALAAVGDHSRDASALAWLKTQFQNSVAPGSADGGFPYQAGGGSDPVSTSIVLQALIAVFQDPAGSDWIAGSSTPVTWLLAHQDAALHGWAGYSGVDVGTTSQSIFGVERVPFPVAGAYVVGTSLASAAPGQTAAYQVPAQACTAAPTPSPTPTPTATPTPTPTATPTPTPTATASPAPTAAPAPTPAPTATAAPPAFVAPPVAEATPSPSPSASASPSPSPTPSVMASVSPAASPTPVLVPDAPPKSPGPAIPAALVYALLASGGVVVVGGGGWLLLRFLGR